MNLDDQDKLKFDRRLEQRRGWLEPGELEAHLEALPDATDKIHDGSEDEAPQAEAAPSAPEAPAAPPAPPLAPPAPSTPEGGFGGSNL